MRTVGVGIIGAGWMGHVHARSYARVRHHYPLTGGTPALVAVADSVPEQLTDFQARHGAVTAYSDWHDLLADPRVQAVSVTAPNFLHAEMGVAIAAAGKDLWIEKPVGLTASDAEAVETAVTAAGVVCTVGFNYRHVPAVMKARHLLRSGAIGRPTHGRFAMFTDYAAHPGGPLSWRFSAGQGGHGVLGDLASHAVDMIRFLLGDLRDVVATTGTFIAERPVVDAGSSHYAVVDPSDPSLVRGDVENQDFVAAMFRTATGVPVVLEASRVAVGEQNSYGFEVHGTRGLVRWDFRRPGELAVSTGNDFQGQATSICLAGPGDGDYAAFQPGTGIAMGYDDTKVIEAFGFLKAVSGQPNDGPTIHDAVASARALDAIVESARIGGWVRVGG